MSEALTHTQIRQLYERFDEGRIGGPTWTDWIRDAVATITWAQGLTDEALQTPEIQKALWNQGSFAGAGPSESLNVDPLLTDPYVIEKLMYLRRNAWPSDASRRAEAIQRLYDELLTHFATALPGNAPKARLQRIFALLRPSDHHVGLSPESKRVMRALVLGKKYQPTIAASVLIRARLRDILGTETSLYDHMVRSTFLWWLYENKATVATGEMPVAAKANDAPPTDDAPPNDATDTAQDSREPTANEGAPEAIPSLVLWTPERQYGSPGRTKGTVHHLKVILRECVESRRFDDLQAAVHAELGPAFANERTLRGMVAQLRRFGLVEESDGRYTTTTAGEQLLEPGPPDELIEALVVRVRAVANVIKLLQSEPKTDEACRDFVGQFVAGGHGIDLWVAIMEWGHICGIFETDSRQHRSLTPLGHQWAERLPATMFSPKDYHLDGGPENVEEAAARPHPTLAELWAGYQADKELREYVFTTRQFRSLFAAWNLASQKRFLIISGLSGTGKTQLMRHAARLICEHMGLDWKRHTLVVPVRPDWRDPTGLLGYFNALHAEPTFQKEAALELVMRAAQNPTLPYFLVLDEMNLARVERYFAPFLSAMETGDHLRLHAEANPINGVPPTVPWPSNLRIGGTVNMDETTYPFSDKVLDRAFTFEFWDVDLRGFLAKKLGDNAEHNAIRAALLDLQETLTPIRRHFGYRTAKEVVDWIGVCREQDPEATLASLIDEAIYSKVLPKLRGTESAELQQTLQQVEKVCETHHLHICKKKIANMITRMKDTGVTSFWS